MKSLKEIILLFCILLSTSLAAQTLTGTVIDKNTKQPIETASVYFDNTTIGTTTNAKGEFSITYTDAVQSPLIISYLGYEKISIANYKTLKHINIALTQATNVLDEVYIEYDDGLTRRQKLRIFRKEFLGTTKYGKSCKILNEDDLILRYNKNEKLLTASAKKPLIIINKALQYKINFELVDFEVAFGYVNISTNHFEAKRILFTGTSFYKNLKSNLKKRVLKNRDKAFKGSTQHFMRALYNKNLEANNYAIFHKGFKVNEWDYFIIEPIINSELKKVTLKHKVSILYDRNKQSELDLDIKSLIVDGYGHYKPITKVLFSGYMGSLRLGDTLPLDYGL